MTDLKSELYAALGRRKLGIPVYTTKEMPKQRPTDLAKFRSELKVAGMDYIAQGEALNKKSAMSEAARMFCMWLLSTKRLSPSDLPQFAASDPELSDPNSDLWGAVPSNLCDGLPEPPTKKKKFEIALPEPPPATVIDAETASTTESDGWTLDNCKRGLNEFCQKMRLPMPVYRIHQHSNEANAMNFSAETCVFLQHLNKTIKASGTGTNKKTAECRCALVLIRQLTGIDVVPSDSTKLAIKTKNIDFNSIDVAVDKRIVERIEAYLEATGSQRVVDINEASPEEPVSLIVRNARGAESRSEIKFDDVVAWAPPLPNWNAWEQTSIYNGPFYNLVKAQIIDKTKPVAVPETTATTRKEYLIHSFKGEILETIRQNQITLIKGSGDSKKSSQVCQYILDDAHDQGILCNIVHSVPRQISAMTLASKVALERNENLGESVGYAVRFKDVLPRPFGSVMYVTARRLLQFMQNGLKGVSHVIVDDVHDRELFTDFVLFLVKDMAQTFPNLKIILMSAPMDMVELKNYFGDKMAVVEIDEPKASVDYFFIEDVINFLNYTPSSDLVQKTLKRRRENATLNETDDVDDVCIDDGSVSVNIPTFSTIDSLYSDGTKAALKSMDETCIPFELIECLLVDICHQGTDGTVLIFLPGSSVVKSLHKRLKLHTLVGKTTNCHLISLYGEAKKEDYTKIFQPTESNVRKVVLATNVAETAFAVNDVAYVIDSCRSRQSGFTALTEHVSTVWASKDNLAHRRRCIRKNGEKGFVFHLCTRKRYELLDDYAIPSILRTPLTEIVLIAKALNLKSAYCLAEKALTLPPIDAIVQGELALKKLGALNDNGEITPLGQLLSTLPMAPTVGKAIVLGIFLGIGDLSCTLAAVASFNVPWIQVDRRHSRLSYCHRSFNGIYSSDHVGLVCANQYYRDLYLRSPNEATDYAAKNGLDVAIMNDIMHASNIIKNRLIAFGFKEDAFIKHNVDPNVSDERLHLLLSITTLAFYPNIAYKMNNRSVRMFDKKEAIISKDSCLLPVDRNQTAELDSPLVVFNNVEHTHTIVIKKVSEITPLQFFLFGSKRIDALGPETVKLDNCITLKMPAYVASVIAALQSNFENAVVNVCKNPSTMAISRRFDENQLIEFLKLLSQSSAWKSHVNVRAEPLPGFLPGFNQNPDRGGHRGYHRPVRGGSRGHQRPYRGRGYFSNSRGFSHHIPGYGAGHGAPPLPYGFERSHQDFSVDPFA